MSSYVGGDVFIAPAVAGAAVALAGAAIFGAGYVLFQGGKLIVDGAVALHDMAEEKRRQAEAERLQKLNAANAAYSAMTRAKSQLISELEASGDPEDAQIAASLRGITDPPPTDDPGAIYLALGANQSMLDKAVRRRERLLDVKVAQAGIEKDVAMSSVLDGLRAAVLSAHAAGDLQGYTPEVIGTAADDGARISQADPIEIRAEYLGRLNKVSANIIYALGEIDTVSQYFGRNDKDVNWLRSCFGGTDRLIERLLSPLTSTEELVNGVAQLELSYEQYRKTRRSILRRVNEKRTYYDAYRQIAVALCEPVLEITDFNSAEEIEAKVHELDARRQLAEQRRVLYVQLGRDMYISRAWEHELKAMGYTVVDKKRVEAVAEDKLTYAELSGSKIPMYDWGDGEKTQFYRVSDSCIMQLIVHKDGTVSMETISASGVDTTREQGKHCALMSRLKSRLRENWLITFDGEEIAGAEQICTEKTWREKPRKRTVRRTNKGTNKKVMHIDGSNC